MEKCDISAGEGLAAQRRRLTEALSLAGCVYAAEEADLLLAEARSAPELERMLARRSAGEPLEQVLGWARFAGLRLAVAPRVFVPRRRTEFLADLAAGLAARAARRRGPRALPVVVDLCCGVGAVAAPLAAARPTELYAVDLQEEAVACARLNLGGSATVLRGDLFSPLPERLRGRVDLLLANAPYLPTARIPTLPAEAREHEDHLALDGGPDGLSVHRRIAAEAPAWLDRGGHVLAEAAEDQAEALCAAYTAAGLAAWSVREEDRDATVVIARRP